MKRSNVILFCIIAMAAFAFFVPRADAFERYKNDAETSGSNCSACHGDFTSDISPKGSVIPSDNKHEMHRGDMNTDCDLCHTTGDSRNPYIGSSNGTANNPGFGCTGCHEEVGLRAHHAWAGVSDCADCHDDPTPNPENTMPTYYGTADTLADNPCNSVAEANMNENWTIGDFWGLDNDGDGLYDTADPDCQAAICGDGSIDPDEACDDGAANGTTICGCQTDCTYTPLDTSCPDVQFCNGFETCDGAGSCQAGTPVDCSDGVSCTDDSCNEASDLCMNTPNNANCPDDGLFCNGVEVCDPFAGCSSIGNPCEPGAVCNEVTNSCDPLGCTSDAECDDGLFCNGTETCDPGNDCQAGTPPSTDDGVACTDDSCDEVNDTVVNAPNNGNCPDDGLFCNGEEVCDPVADCSPTGDPCPQGTTCNDIADTCDEIPVVIDLDIAAFQTSKNVRISGKNPKAITIKLTVMNNGSFNNASRPATVIGLQNGIEVYNETLQVSDTVGNGRSRFNYPSYLPTEAGVINWTVQIVDDDPDDDTATAATQVN